MRKILVLLCMMSYGMTFAQTVVDSVRVQPKRDWVQEKFSFSFLAGATNQFSSPTMVSFGLSLTVYNVYLDWTFKPAGHAQDVKVDVWKNQKKNSNFHIGYRLPYKQIGFTPVIGFSQYKILDVDGNNWNINNSGIHNSEIVKENHTRTDYGIVFDYHTEKNDLMGWKFQVELTRYNALAGIGIYF